MDRRELLAGALAVPIAGALTTSVPAAAMPPRWYIGLHSKLPPFKPERMAFYPFAGAFPGKLLPVSDRPIVLGEYAGFVVTGYQGEA